MTKRQIGLFLLAGGGVGIMGVVVLDVIRRKPITTIQLLAIIGCLGLVLMGAALFPLGDRPA